MFLMARKGIRGRKCNSFYRYANRNNKYIKDYDKNKKSSYIEYWDVNYLYGLETSQKFSVTFGESKILKKLLQRN